MGRPKSRRKEGRSRLGDAEDLLITLANLPDDGLINKEAADQLLRGRLKRHQAAFADLFAFIPGNRDYHEVLWRFRYYLRQAWTAEPRVRDWFMLRAREVEARYKAAAAVSNEPDLSKRNVAIEKSLDELPALTPLEAAFVHLQKLQDSYKTLKCANQDCAVTPYFIRTRQGQFFCNEICANFKRREYKRKRWHEKRGKKGEHNAKRTDRKDR